MKTLLAALLITTAAFFPWQSSAQILSFKTTRLSLYDSLKLSGLPPLRLKQPSRDLLPPVVDNSQLPYLRPVFSQTGYECGQASSIGYLFTYEMNCSRNTPADIPENQYTPYFPYNFINHGIFETGVSYYETFEVIKNAGCPTIADYGGYDSGLFSRWMDGYQLYYNAMHNRLTDVYSIKVDSPEGIQTLKNWIYDHGNGSAAGGLACFYSEVASNMSDLPPGTPEAGKKVIIHWGNFPNHAMTILGYNDSIRFDYNNDGLYTNDVDLNNDGIIDVRDWEIGGFKMVNSYGTQFWGDAGFAYLMYKTLADKYGMGGIWNNMVVVIDVNDTHVPKLTAKAGITYGCRNKLRITAGVSADPSATEPDYILELPAFNFQGGCLPMQGEGASDTIEIGLDLNPLLHYIQPGQPARFFLIVTEDDAGGEYAGTINHFSVIDYTTGMTQYNSNISNLPIENNSLTMVPVTAQVNYDPVTILSDTLPETVLYNNVSYSLQATGGTPPYHWHMADDYIRYDSTAGMQSISAHKLQLSSYYNGKAKINLPFGFPFYGKVYDEIYATVDGYLMFEDNELPWPYIIEGRTFFIQTAMIAPVLCTPFIISDPESGIWYEESSGCVIFRWRLNVWGASWSVFNATAKLFPSGRIEFNYGTSNLPSWVKRYPGISGGNGENFLLISDNSYFSPTPGQMVIFTPQQNNGLNLSTDGVLSGKCMQPVSNSPLTVCVSDRDNIRDYRTLYISTTGLQIDYNVTAGNDNKIEFGEDVLMDVIITNHNQFPVNEISVNLTGNDTYYTFVDTSSATGSLLPGESVHLYSTFHLVASNNIPDRHLSNMIIQVTTPEGEWNRDITLKAFRPVTEVKLVTYDDDNYGFPEPGESFGMHILVKNTGGANLVNALATVTSDDPYLTLLTSTVSIDTLAPFGEWELIYSMALSPQTPIGYNINLPIEITGHNGFIFNTQIRIQPGIAIENFESNDLSLFGWETGADHPWYIEQGIAYEGNYCARSAAIIDNQSSYLKRYWNVPADDSISFWLKVDSETFDGLSFYINNLKKGEWWGNTGWFEVKYYVPAGEKTFKWTYKKNAWDSNGEDCARLDYVVFPQLTGSIPVTNLQIPAKLSLYPNPAKDEFTIRYTLSQPGPVSITIYNTHGQKIYHQEATLQPGEYTLSPALGTLTPGMYTVQLTTAGGSVVRKMCKM